MELEAGRKQPHQGRVERADRGGVGLVRRGVFSLREHGVSVESSKTVGAP